MQDFCDASGTVETEDTQGTNIGLRHRRKSYSINAKMKVLAKYEHLGQHICIKFCPYTTICYEIRDLYNTCHFSSFKLACQYPSPPGIPTFGKLCFCLACHYICRNTVFMLCIINDYRYDY